MFAPSIISALLWCTSLCFFTLVGSAFLALAVFFPPKRLQPIVRLGCRGVLSAAGQRLRLSGQFPPLDEGPYIYMFNHSSMLDTFVMLAVIPEFVGAVGKREQFEVPLWGSILRRWGAIPIDRTERADAIQRLREVELAVGAGLSLLISPEGTRSSDGELGEFKKGPFHVANNSGASVLPVAIRGAFRAKSRGSWMFRPGTIEVIIGAPIQGEDGVEDAVDDLRQQTAQALRKLLAS